MRGFDASRRVLRTATSRGDPAAGCLGLRTELHILNDDELVVHRREWRAGLIERYGLARFPQALAIVGAKGPVGTGPTAASTGRPGS